MKPTDPTEPLFARGSGLHLATHNFDPCRLTLARELRGLTKSDLAGRIGKTAAAIGQFESGAARPEARTVAAMALALGVQVGFFASRSRPCPIINGDHCHFRSLRASSQRARRRVMAAGSLLCDLVAELEEEIEFPPNCVSPAARDANTIVDLEAYADEVRRVWGLGLGPIPHLLRLLESKGILITIIQDSNSGIDAFSSWHRGRPIVFLVDDQQPTRIRFDAAHELAHLLMHADAVPGDTQLERQAHRFAAAFLVPRESFLAECPRRLNWEHFYELKRRWRVSVQVLIRRAFDLGVFSHATFRRACVQLNVRNERIHERFEPEGEAPSMIGDALHELRREVSMAVLAERLRIGESDFHLLARQIFENRGDDQRD